MYFLAGILTNSKGTFQGTSLATVNMITCATTHLCINIEMAVMLPEIAQLDRHTCRTRWGEEREVI